MMIGEASSSSSISKMKSFKKIHSMSFCSRSTWLSGWPFRRWLLHLGERKGLKWLKKPSRETSKDQAITTVLTAHTWASMAELCFVERSNLLNEEVLTCRVGRSKSTSDAAILTIPAGIEGMDAHAKANMLPGAILCSLFVVCPGNNSSADKIMFLEMCSLRSSPWFWPTYVHLADWSFESWD